MVDLNIIALVVRINSCQKKRCNYDFKQDELTVQARMETNLYGCVLKDMVVWESGLLLRTYASNRVFCRVPVLKSASKWVPVKEGVVLCKG